MKIITEFQLLCNRGAHISTVGACADTREFATAGKNFHLKERLKLNEGSLTISFAQK